MQDVERVAEKLKYTLQNDIGMSVRVGDLTPSQLSKLAAAISAMTPDTALSHALHAGEDVGYVRGWNAAIEAAADTLEQRVGDEWLRAAQVISQLNKPTGNLAPTPTDSV